MRDWSVPDAQGNYLLQEDWGLCEEFSKATLVEARSPGRGKPGDVTISGIFMQAEVVNRNGRKYPKAVLEKSVSKYMQEQVLTNQALGELNHPPRANVDPEHAAIRITNLTWKGNNVMGEAVVLNTPKGKIVKALIEGGWVPGVSSRGLGSVKQVNGINEVQDGFRLTVGVDVVWGPSAPSAYVQAQVTESTNQDSTFTNLTEMLEKLL